MEDSYTEIKKHEEMKLRIHNMSLSLIAGLGVLLGYRGKYGIFKAMQDPDITELINRIITIVIKTIEHPKQLNPKVFAQDALERLNNPNIPDDPARIAFNGSIKLLPRFMNTYFAGQTQGLTAEELAAVLLPVAGFLRYTLGVDDQGVTYHPEDDPHKQLLISCASKAKLGEPTSATAFKQIISYHAIMGKNLYHNGNSGKTIEDFLRKMLAGPGAVRKTLSDFLSGENKR